MGEQHEQQLEHQFLVQLSWQHGQHINLGMWCKDLEQQPIRETRPFLDIFGFELLYLYEYNDKLS